MILDVAHCTRPKRGESENGDAAIVRKERDATLFGVVDALGHGAPAAAAAERATSFLARAPLAGGIASVVAGLHDVLRGTRGAAATLCLCRGGVLEGCGVGNVELRSRGTAMPFVLSRGILGSNHSALKVFSQPLARGDRLAIFSDGVSRALSIDYAEGHPAAAACRLLFDEYSGPSDDATLLFVEAQ